MVGVPMKEKPQSKSDCPNIIPNKISSRERRSTESSTESESSEDEEGVLEVNCPEIEEKLTVSGKELTPLKNGSPKLIPKTRRFLKRKRTDSSTESDSSENNEENTDENCLGVEEKLTVSEKEMTLSKNDSRRLQKKKRMESSTDSSEEDTLPESCLEVEDNLNKSALRNNLSADDVKTILKKVVSNEHVLALVKLREEELLAEEGNAVPEPKLTRSKIKELRNTSSAVPWTIPLTPVKNNPVTSPEVTALIVQDMPEEESDEEYDPAHDEESDDGEPLEFHSDVDSQPKTPATPGNSSILELESPTIPINWSKDGLFKIPKVILHEISNLTPTKGKMTKEEEATIARRTRSKLSFSDTPIEQLQDSFVPPDIPADMYDFEEIHRMDNVWRDFLQEFMKPLPQSHEEADDDADPEYNHQADSNTLIEDEVLDNAEARVSRRELNDLVAELFDDIDFPLLLPLTSNTNPEQVINDEQQDANALLDNSTDSLKILDLDVHNTDIKYESFVKSQEVETETSKEVEEIQDGNDEIIGSATEEEEWFPIPVKDERVCAQIPLEPSAEQQEEGKATIVPPYIIVEAAGFSALHRGMLQQQLRMHVQFLAQNFIQAYGHPELWDLGPKLKQMMTHLIEMAGSLPESIFSVCNLQPAFELLQEWEAQLSEDTPENQEYIRFVKKESERIKRKHGCHIKHVQNFPPNIIKIIANSPVFLYPHLLPPQPFRVDLKRTMRDQTKKWLFVESEDHYISLGLEQFEKLIKKQRRKKFKKKQREVSVKDICEMMTPHMLPFVTAKSVISRIGNVRNANRVTEGHPIMYYFQHGKVKETKHNVFPYDMKKAPKDYSNDILPGVWKKYCGEGRVFSSLENERVFFIWEYT